MFFCSTFNKPFCSCCFPQGRNRPQVTAPSYTRQALGHTKQVPTCTDVPQGGIPFVLAAHRTVLFPSEMLQLSLSTLQVGKILVSGACQLECRLECSTYSPNCSVSLPSLSQRHKLGHCKSHQLF